MLTIPETTEDVAAGQLAERIIVEAIQNAQRTAHVLDNGVPARPAQEARVGPSGQTIPARPAVPAISAIALRAAIGAENLAKLAAARTALLG